MRLILSADRKKNVEIVAESRNMGMVNPDYRRVRRRIGDGMPFFIQGKTHQREYCFAEDS